MSAEKEHLKQALRALEAELPTVPELDAATRARLEALLGEAAAAVAAAGAAPAEPQGPAGDEPSVLDRLRETTAEFEQSHPVLFGSVKGVIDAMGRMGI